MKGLFRQARLTQAQAARIIGIPPQRVTEALRLTPEVSANRRSLDLLLAVWPELDEAARERVTDRLQAGRSAPAVSPDDAARQKTLAALRAMVGERRG